jgi:hypothetical protein
MQHFVFPAQVLPVNAATETTLSEILTGEQDLNSKLNFDAFSKLRVSQSYGLLESKFLFSKQNTVWEDVTDTSGVSTYLSDESAVHIQVGSGANDYCLRQTYMYLPYIAGNGQRILLTGNFESKETGRVKRIGYFDNYNGLFFELSSDDLYVVVRSNTSGSPVDTRVKRTDFNIDKLDGTGPSGITIDFSMRQIFLIQFQWLGVGTVSYGFSYRGKIYLCHQIHHANTGTTTYMANPNLPVRYEIRNTGTPTGTGSMKQICASVASDGGYQIPGYEFAAGNGATGKSVSTTRTMVLAIRLKTSFNGKPNRRLVRLKQMDALAISGNAYLEIIKVSGVTATTGTWSDVENDSCIEISTNISAYTATDDHKLDAVYIASGNGGTGGGIASEFTTLGHNSVISQNYACTQSSMFVVYATATSGTVTTYNSLSWTEFE